MGTRERYLKDSVLQLPYGVLDEWEEQKFAPFTRTQFESTTARFGPLPPSKRGIQVTVSETHNWDGRKNRPTEPGDVGGPFKTQKRTIRVVDPTRREFSRSVQSDQSFTRWHKIHYNGPVLAFDPASVVYPTSAESSDKELIAKGTTAIARCKPTNSVADVATALAELYSEGLPKLAGSALWEQRTLRLKDTGNEYLNQEFGWQPMISDIRSIAQAVASSHALLKAYEKNSGSFVRRRYSFPEERTSVTTLKQAYGTITTSPSPLFVAFGPPGVVYLKEDTYRDVWFSGAFTYHLPSGFKSRNAIARMVAKADALLGLDLRPEVLWNAAPWSWAVDWFSNAGDLISNFSDWSTDGLVLKYGYIMEHSFASNTYFVQGPHRFSDLGFDPSPVVASVETKRRLEATPYGFGLDWSSFSPRQWSIISALGLTKSKK
jgi:hypothetical protein